MAYMIPTTPTKKVCRNVQGIISQVIHKGVLSTSNEEYRSCNVSKYISLLLQPEETVYIQFSMFYSKERDGTNKLRCNIQLNFQNNLHDASKSYVYGTYVYAYMPGYQMSSHTLLFTNYQRRETSQIIIYETMADCSNTSYPGFYETFAKNTDSNQHVCFGVRRYNLEAQNISAESIGNVNVGKILLDSGLYSDISFVVEDKTFRVHKAILGAASNVFQAMFSHDMVEKKTSQVVIDDFSSEIVEALLSYVYVGKTSIISKNPVEIFQIANKYAVKGLETKCIEYFLFILNSDNAVYLLDIAHMYGLSDLTKNILAFISKQEARMVHEPTYQKFLCRNMSVVSVIKNIKLCSKYPGVLTYVQNNVFEFAKSHASILASDIQFLDLFKTHPESMKQMFVYFYSNN